MTRTFIALEMNTALQRHLEEVTRQVARALPGVRWLDPAGIHLTLAFLGELNDEQLSEAMNASAAAARQVKAFSYRLSRLGIFGSPRQPRIIWMGIEEPSGSLVRLHRLLNQALEQRGFEIDQRPFSPHLTLARIKSPLTPGEQQELQRLLTGDQRGIASSTNYSASLIHMMKSELSRSGAHYTSLHEYVFGGVAQ
ncbi:MAG TPA: RNA 2',3'-cyclic phosphodiesterase [Ktedonosporobacter sp.]|jgi:2'-5' RNA ligase|nr:RNA 2',3'-cyclic phosphodiesterase [Ktedonosporobacter sp.]